jgi:D-alanine-D-alanine ligase
VIRVLVVHNADFGDAAESSDSAASDSEPPPVDAGHAARAEVREVAIAIADALCAAGRLVRIVPVKRVAEVTEAVRQFNAHVVFNLCESLDGDPRYESSVAAILERMNVAFTGAPSPALRVCLDKHACSEAIRRRGVQVPWSVSADVIGDLPHDITFPVIVKPNREDGSTGIESASVAHDRAQVAQRLAQIEGSAIVQQYIQGREVNVALLGAPMKVLSIGEIDFSEMPDNLPQIVSYAAKWDESSLEWRGTRAVQADLTPALTERIKRLATDTARALDLRGYARLDIRIDKNDQPWVIDVNPNCGLAPNAGFALAAARSGYDYGALVGTIVAEALGRKIHPNDFAAHQGRGRRPGINTSAMKDA